MKCLAGNGTEVNTKHCADKPPPNRMEACNRGECPVWRESEWDQVCIHKDNKDKNNRFLSLASNILADRLRNQTLVGMKLSYLAHDKTMSSDYPPSLATV